MTSKLCKILLIVLSVIISGCSGGNQEVVLLGITISPGAPSMAPGSTLQFTATALYSDGSTQNITTSVVWSSSNTAVAAISNADASHGLASAVAVGVTTVTATSSDVTTSVTLTVSTSGTAPARVVAVSAAPHLLTTVLDWNNSPSAANYNVYWSTAPGVTKNNGTKIAGIQGTSYVHEGLWNGATYYYVVTAQNSFGESDESVELKSKPYQSASTFQIVEPVRGAVVGKAVHLSVPYSPSFTHVTASVLGRQTTLAYSTTALCSDTGCDGWSGTLSFEGLPKGEQVLTVTVSTQSEEVTASRSVFFNPSLSVSAPLDFEVARPSVRLTASCMDEELAPCKSLKVYESNSRTLLAAGVSSIDEIVSLAQYDGKSVTLSFESEDASGHVVVEPRTVLVESSTNISALSGTTGAIWDLHQDRILYLDTTRGARVLKIRDRATGADSVVSGDYRLIPRYGYLSPNGAIFVEQSGTADSATVYDWADGSLTYLGFIYYPETLRVSGDYAIWNLKFKLYARNLRERTQKIVPPQEIAWAGNSVAANGDVAYIVAYNNKVCLYRYGTGLATELTPTIPFGYSNGFPLTDGTNVIYRKRHSLEGGKSLDALALITPSGEEMLTPEIDFELNPSINYMVKNGWTAFTMPDSAGNMQIWLRSQGGVVSQLTSLSAKSEISALGPNGDIAWVSGGRLYLNRIGGPTIEIGASLGKPYFLDGQWFVVIGNTVFSVRP